MKIQEIRAITIMNKSKLPEAAYCINPYVGCSHRCVYCYARFMRRFTGHQEAWGSFVDVKVNVRAELDKQLKRMRKLPSSILIGSVCDAYQPIEKHYEITRSILQGLQNYDMPISILTKSDLIVRDIDILKRCHNIRVGFSFCTTDEEVRIHMEPKASSVKERLAAMRILHEQGIATYAFVGPIIPALTNLPAIFEAIHKDVDEVWAEALNVRCGNEKDMDNCMRKHYPNIVEDYQTHVKDDVYWQEVEQQFITLAKHYNLPCIGFYMHT